MSTASLNQATTAAPRGLGLGGPPPTDSKQSSTGDRLYRVIWRWHFYAGMIVAPALIVVAATGALYIFKDELDAVLHPGVTYVEPAAERVSYEQQLAAARAAVPTMPRIALMQIFSNPKRATSIAMFGSKFQYSYVDPYTGRYLGGIESGGFFDIVLKLHRSLFLGTTGRIVVELTTCWTIVLVATGVYLWWPRKWNQVWGVWLPRLRKKPYVVLRDLHTVTGIYVAIIAIVISLTGLIYTYVWGRPYQNAARSEPNDMFGQPMQSKSPPDAKELPIDRFIELGHEKMPGKTLTVWFPRGPNGVYLVFGRSEYGPSVHEMLFIDRATGEILEHRHVSQTPPMYWLGTWNYPLHVGTILGMPSKILWLVTCVILMTSPLTGVWMWWERRPKGRLGLPRRVDARRPRWLVATIAATSILFPTLGISVVVVLVVEFLRSQLRRVGLTTSTTYIKGLNCGSSEGHCSTTSGCQGLASTAACFAQRESRPIMRINPFVLPFIFLLLTNSTAMAVAGVVFSGERLQNNLVAELLEVVEISQPSSSFSIKRAQAGYIFVTADCRGAGTVTMKLDDLPEPFVVIRHEAAAVQRSEAVRSISLGEHTLKVECAGGIHVEKLVVKAIPELMHCGLGFDPAVQSYGKYDLAFLQKDILPNVTTLIVPSNIKLEPTMIDEWHRQGKRFVAAAGVNFQAKTVEEHYNYWTGFFEKAPFLDGIIIDEFIVNNPIREWLSEITPERQQRFDEERAQYPIYEEAFRRIRANQQYRGKMVYAYIGGSAKKLNQEIIGPTFVRSILDCNFCIGLERYLFEVSSEQKSKDALQSFVDGIADWVAKEPTVRERMVLTLGLFSMPPGGLNKQPNVDYHVWMDQQMNVVANHPIMAGMAGLNWWTSLQADEETVRFVGKLYRHYAIEGKKELLTKDPLFLTHIQNADFEKQFNGWTLHAAEEGSIQAKSFPRYGRIEGRYMGLGRPADPEHIGDTFLWMKRSAKGPNSFSQPIKDLQPGRLYALKMLTCDYRDLISPQKKNKNEAQPFIGNISIEGVDVDPHRSFHEAVSSSPEPPIPVWITYHWLVFRAKSPTASITVSDWDPVQKGTQTFGQEQTFNFLELEPYQE